MAERRYSGECKVRVSTCYGVVMGCTSPLPAGRARGVARMMENSGNYLEVRLRLNEADGTAEVHYLPTNPNVQARLARKAQAPNTERAAAQVPEFTFRRTHYSADLRTEVFIVTGLTGVYTTCLEGARQGCTCPHYETRLRAAGLACKHMEAIRLKLQERDERRARQSAGDVQAAA